MLRDWGLLRFALFVLYSATAGSAAKAEDGDGHVLENEWLRVVVAPAGGRISALVDKASGSDLVALWC